MQTFQNWVEELRRRFDPLPPGTTAAIFRLLFPDEDAKRKYDMQETRLAQSISRALCVSHKMHERGESLAKWKAETAVGCLGLEVRRVIQESGVRYITLSWDTISLVYSSKETR